MYYYLRAVGTVVSNTRNKVGGQYPLKAIGELNRNLLSDTVAQLNATVSRPDIARLFRTSPPNNVLNIAVHGLYNPPSGDGHRNRRHHATTTCSAMFHVPGAIDLRVTIKNNSNNNNEIFWRAQSPYLWLWYIQVFLLFWFYFLFLFLRLGDEDPLSFSVHIHTFT